MPTVIQAKYLMQDYFLFLVEYFQIVEFNLLVIIQCMSSF